MLEARLFRDDLGIPHLRGSDELSLAFGQGRVTALDRAWQIEADRWRAEGRLAAFIGSSGLEWDRYAARSRLGDTARRAYKSLAADDRAWINAYVAGVNVGLTEGRSSSVEFSRLSALPGRHPPHEPWDPWVPLGIFHVAHTLMSTFPNVLWRSHVERTAGTEWLRRFESGWPAQGGSNAWALGGSLTGDGAPLLAGDPHRLLEVPGVYQQIRLACPEYDVVGLSFPGVPGVQHFGHTGAVAWGVTNAVAHADQVFREHILRSGRDATVVGPSGPEPAHQVDEEINVRGVGVTSVRCIETRRGTVIVDGAQSFSVRQPARVHGDLGFSALRPLLRARRAPDVFAALGSWIEPVNRVMVADSEGTVLRGTVGRCPKVPFDQRWLPHDPTVETPSAWLPVIPPEAVDAWAVDANERPQGRRAHDLGDSYPSSDRADRIASWLEQSSNVTAADLESLQSDTLSLSAVRLVDLLHRSCRAASLSPAARRLLDDLVSWDRRMDRESRTAASFAVWRSTLVRRLVSRPALTVLESPHGMGAIFDPWFNVSARVAASLESLLEATELGIDGPFEMIGALESAAGATGTTWGQLHTIAPLHVLDDIGTTAIRDLLSSGLSGDTDSVLATASIPGVTDMVSTGPVARWIWNLGNREESRWGVPFGASGEQGSIHFTDQVGAWRDGRTTAVVTAWSRLVEVPWAPA